MKKALLLAPMGSVHRRFNGLNIQVLKDLGYEVHLAANFDHGEGTEEQNPEYAKQSENEGIIVHSIPYQRHEIKQNIKLVKPTRDLIQNENFDLIHAHTETGGLILRLVGKTKGRKIYTPHGMSFYKGAPLKAQMIYRPIEKWICSGMNCNIAINQEEYNTLKSWNPKTATLVHGVGLDLGRFQGKEEARQKIRKELNIPEDAIVVLSVGELDDNKNHTVVLDALKETKAYYVICGTGPNKDKLIEQADRIGMNNRFILAGYRKDIPEIIAACDIFAFPSFHEGLPVSLMEAMAGGLPAVCSDIRGNIDLITNEKEGYLAHPDDLNSWKTRLDQIINDPNERIQMKEKTMKKIRLFSEESIQSELNQIYQKVGNE